MAKKAFGSKLTIGDNLIGEILSITPPGPSRSVIDTTHMGSADETMTKLGGIIDAGEISALVQMDLSSADGEKHLAAITAVHNNGAPVTFVVQCGDVATITGNAVVTAFQPEELTSDGKQTATINLAVSGKPTVANVTS